MKPRPLPALDETVCLLDRTAGATCDACARACPTGALRLGDDGLELIADLCTACGACGATCPVRAITVDRAVPLPLTETDASGAVVMICPEVRTVRGTGPCLQALGLEGLAALWLRGIRRLLVETASCDTCPSGRGLPLIQHLETLNALLADRGLPLMSAGPLPARGADHLPRMGQGPDARRRGLLAFSAARPEAAGPKGRQAALARLQGLPGRGTFPRFAHSPVIDPQSCTACHLCLRICPEAALTLIIAEDQPVAYRVDAARCTGCGLCVQSCEEGAISIVTLATATDGITLVSRQCRGCLVAYQRPADALRDDDGLCPICARAPHYRKLHQVLR